MTDEAYVLKETNKERIGMKNGAYHKKSGAKSKTCRFPSDYLTSKEKKALNGPVTSWEMNKFYSWEEFKHMPKDIQEAYLTTLSHKYKIGLSTISRELFGHGSPTTLFKYIKDNGLQLNLFKTSGTGARNASEAFRKVLSGEHQPVQEVYTPEKIEEKPEPVSKPIIEPSSKIMSATVTTDSFDVTVFNYLGIMFKDKKVKVTIMVVET